MIRYQRNNILFRIASADAIARFKEAQVHSFIQVSRKELNFDIAAKEVVLLEFDRFSQLIFRVERICLGAGEGLMRKQLANAIFESIHEEFSIIETVLETHPEVFTREVVNFTKLVHTYSSDMLNSALVSLMADKHIDDAFSNAVQALSHYLQHLLIAMHEFNDNMIRKQFPFIGVADFCVDFLPDVDNFIPCETRARYFLEHGIGPTFILKNYSKHDVFERAQKKLAEDGIILVPEEVHELNNPA